MPKLKPSMSMTRKARAAAGLAPPPAVHGAVKGVNPDLKPEKQAMREAKTKVVTPLKASSRNVLTPHSSPGLSSSASTPDKFYTPSTTPQISSPNDLRARLKKAILENRPLYLPSGDNDQHSKVQTGLNPLRLQLNDKLPS